jgi:D,D-heptose 1,7-bisphosphate phosphatase
MNAAIFLDRDNTIIHNDADLGDPDKVRLIQGTSTAIASLCGLGYKVVVITNQGGVARGKYTEEDVHAVHQRIDELVAAGANGAKIEAFYYCPYHPDGTVSRYRKEHPGRKPGPGMLQEAARDLGLDLSQSWTIGDQVRDVQAGLAAGTRAILLRQDADRLKPFDPREHPGLDPSSGETPEPKATPDFYVRNLVEAVRIVAQQRKPEVTEHIHHSGSPTRKWDAAAVAKLQRKRPSPSEQNPADERSDGPISTLAEAQQAGRPFKPWNVPLAEPDDDEPDTTEAPQSKPAVPAEVEPVSVEVQPAAKPAPATAEADEKTLRLILQELRNQRGAGLEFSFLRIMAIVLQTVACACLLGAFWLGAGDDNLFLRLAGAALLTQLAVITALLWDR